MNSKTGRIVSLVTMAAVIVYTVMNYLSGRSSIGFVLAAVVFIGMPMVNIIRLMLDEAKDK